MAKKENNEMSWAKSKMHDVLLWLIHIDRKANQKIQSCIRIKLYSANSRSLGCKFVYRIVVLFIYQLICNYISNIIMTKAVVQCVHLKSIKTDAIHD